jgi:hypothetical protein
MIVAHLPATSVLFASIKHEEVLSYALEYVEATGEICRVRLNLTSVATAKPEEAVMFRSRAAIQQWSTFLQPLHPAHFFAFRTSLAIVDGHQSAVSIVDVNTGARSELRFHLGGATCVSSQGTWMVTSGRDAVVVVFSVAHLKSPVYRIPLYRDEITCCAVSSEFGLIASGTRDGFLVLSSVARGSNVHVINLVGCRPYAVLITESWGFVVICMTKLEHGTIKRSISVYNTNGMFIRTAELPEAMAAWTSWSSPSGFDFLLIVGDQGRLWYCEAFLLEFSLVKGCKKVGKVVALSYHPKEMGMGILIVYDDGDVGLVPFSPDV